MLCFILSLFLQHIPSRSSCVGLVATALDSTEAVLPLDLGSSFSNRPMSFQNIFKKEQNAKN